MYLLFWLLLHVRRAPQQTQIHMTQQMTTKVAPAYDGRTSFFAFEDAIDDWCDITELEPEKRGPAFAQSTGRRGAAIQEVIGQRYAQGSQ